MLHARSDYQRIQDPKGKIPEDEPVMLFRAQDKFFIDVLCHYAELLEADKDARPDIIQAVNKHIVAAEDWQERHPTKTPDLP